LAYLKSNCALITEANGIERLKQANNETDDPIIKKNIDGILYLCAKAVETSSSSTGHIMISYNWGNQPIVKKISQSLKENGYKVWLDLEQMSGSTLEAMAKAVEQAEVVLICMSQKYKDSPNCRLEGEYCVTKKVAFVPLMMQTDYRPDGWLGIALGSKLWYDFSTEGDWESKVAALVKAIGDKGKGKDSNLSTHPAPTGKPQAVNWTLEDMRQWMIAERIDRHFEIFKKHEFDGRALLELKSLLNAPQPSFFATFKEMCKELGILGYGDILRLCSAIRILS